MRKISEKATRAFYNWDNYNKSNTRVAIDWVSNRLYLHWNLIAELKNSEEGEALYISSAGWESNTSKERLNWVLDRNGLWIRQKNFNWFLVSNTESIEFKVGNSLNWVTIF
jgi:hypothetical protein